jgi:NADP-dependent 3-hydroxy acid dehydrogenase YdfG
MLEQKTLASKAPYQTLITMVITGGCSGLGRAMAQALIERGKPIILFGRARSKAECIAREVGAPGHYELDTGNVEAINEALKFGCNEQYQVCLGI